MSVLHIKVVDIDGPAVETTIRAEGMMFVWDECHKIYLITSEEGRRQMLECGWSESEFRHPSELPQAWEDSCGLRFISNADLNQPEYVPQLFADDDGSVPEVTVTYE